MLVITTTTQTTITLTAQRWSALAPAYNTLSSGQPSPQLSLVSSGNFICPPLVSYRFIIAPALSSVPIACQDPSSVSLVTLQQLIQRQKTSASPNQASQPLHPAFYPSQVATTTLVISTLQFHSHYCSTGCDCYGLLSHRIPGSLELG